MKVWKVIPIFLILVLKLSAQGLSTPQLADTIQQSVDLLPGAIQHSIDSLPIIKQERVDSLPIAKNQPQQISILNDSIILPSQKTDTLALPGEFKPDPKKAIIFAAIFPGLGQIYNRKYWKLPIIYGGFIGFTYAITWNNRYYQDYSQGYKDIMDDDPNTDSWTNFLRFGQDPESVDKTWLKDVLKRRKDYYRRYRDLSIIGSIALYGLGIVDAYVDAQLFDFDISQDLSMKVEPALIQKNNYYLADSFGVRCSINF